MSKQFDVVILETHGFKPTDWKNNPADGILIGINEPMTLKAAQQEAQGFNKAELKNPANLWACVVPTGTAKKPYQRITIQGSQELN